VYLTAQLSVSIGCCHPYLLLTFHSAGGPGLGGGANKMEGKWKVFLYLVRMVVFVWGSLVETIVKSSECLACAVRKNILNALPVFTRVFGSFFGTSGNITKTAENGKKSVFLVIWPVVKKVIGRIG